MENNKSKFLNYLLSIGFIFLIVILLSSMVFISRYVLSSAQLPINEHVKSTQNILENIKEVESITKSENHTNEINLYAQDFFKINSNNFKVSKPSMINLEKNQSIFTFFINGEIGKIENSFYKKIDGFEKLEIKDLVVYSDSKIGYIIEIKSDEIKIINSKTSNIQTIKKEEINGVIFFKNED